MPTIRSLAERARAAMRSLGAATVGDRDAALMCMADKLVEHTAAILASNALDVEAGLEKGLAASFVDRLRLDEARVAKMAAAVREVALLPSPLGRIEDIRVRPNGIRVGRMRIPLGVIAIIYEARPNVTSDAACLCLKAGNAVILKGGRNAQRSNDAIVLALQAALTQTGLPADAVQLLSAEDRERVDELLKLDDLIDLVIPRGGEGLIRFVAQTSSIPVLKHYKGVCHVYLDASADPTMSVAICENAKVQRPSVCNAVETILVHEGAVDSTLLPVAQRLHERGVTLHVDADAARHLEGHVPTQPATDEDYYAEYLSLDVAIRVVTGLEQAIGHIQTYGSDHTEVIVTSDYARANRFVERVDSACVLVNASTRFADGGELGLGAEIGISTTKLHAFGPMGLEELTSRKFVVYGDGQVRP